MSNPWRDFTDLLPRSPLRIAHVDAHNADGTSTVTMPDGGTLIVRGQGVAIDDYAYIRDGEVRGQASAVTPLEFEV